MRNLTKIIMLFAFFHFHVVLLSQNDDLYFVPGSKESSAPKNVSGSKKSSPREKEEILIHSKIINSYQVIEGELIILHYDLLGSIDSSYQIEVSYLHDNSEVPIKYAIGAIGNGVICGKNKRIYIDYEKEGIKPIHLNSTKYRINIIADTTLGRNINKLTQKGNKVYIDSDDKAVRIHASFELRGWGYWQVVDNKVDADFILRISCRTDGFSSEAFAEFIDPISNKILRVTDRQHGGYTDMNYKRGTVRMLVDQKIIKYYDEY